LVEGTPWFVYFSIDDKYEVRWDRIGKTPHDLEQKSILDRAVAARIIEDAKDNELY
jgi:signal peptidase I